MAIERIINSHQAYAKLLESSKDNNKVININITKKDNTETFYITKKVNNTDYFSDTTDIIIFNDGNKDCFGYCSNPYFNFSFGNEYETWIATTNLDIAKKDFVNREVYKIDVNKERMTIESKNAINLDELTEDKGIQRKRIAY